MKNIIGGIFAVLPLAGLFLYAYFDGSIKQLLIAILVTLGATLSIAVGMYLITSKK
jgi:uncharacterized membrane protein YccC